MMKQLLNSAFVGCEDLCKSSWILSSNSHTSTPPVTVILLIGFLKPFLLRKWKIKNKTKRN